MNNNDEIYIIYGLKGQDQFFITNIEPLLWEKNIAKALRFRYRYTAESTVLRDYDTYHIVKDMIQNGTLDGFYLGILQCGIEIGRFKLL